MTSLIAKYVKCHVASGVDTRSGLNTSAKLAILLFVYGLGHLVAGAYYYWHAVYLGMKYPYNSYLCLPVARFSDFDNMLLMCKNLNPYHDYTRSGYPPFANFFFYLFTPLSVRYGFFIFVLAPVIFARWVTFYILDNVSLMERTCSVVFLMLFSYPFLFTLDRGNIEFFILIATGTFFAFYHSPRSFFSDLACFGLGAAIAIKIYPIVLLLVPIKDGRYVDCAKILTTALLLTLFAASTFTGGAMIAFSDFHGMLATTGQLVKDQLIYAHGNAGIFYGVVIILKYFGLTSALAVFNHVYWLIGGLVLLTYSVIILVSRISFWGTCTCVAAIMCLVPSLSNDYRTLQILVPMLLFARSFTPITWSYRAIAIIFGLLLVPRNYWLMFPEVDPGDIGIGGVITPFLLFLLLNIVLIVEHRRWSGLERAAAAVA